MAYLIQSPRLVPLEAYRGMAAIVVLVHHFFLGFSPTTTGWAPSARTSESLVGTWYFAAFNGPAAVIFFFTLSGFVLCWSYFHHEKTESLLAAFLKRYPRLVAIVTITTVASYLLFELGLYSFRDAGIASGSRWLYRFAGELPADFKPSFTEAFGQGITTFFTGRAHYNENLWTMKPEFFGSLVVYMLAAFLVLVLRRRYLIYAFLVLCVSVIFYNKYLFPFVVGLFLSMFLAGRQIQISKLAAISMIAAGLYLLGFAVAQEAYAWVSYLPGIVRAYFPVVAHTVGSAAIIAATVSNSAIFKRLDGKFFRLLGKLSFPIYLAQLLVIGSVASAFYLWLLDTGLGRLSILCLVFAATLVGTVLASIPLMRFDDWWVARVNERVKKVLGQPATHTVTAPQVRP